jgi:hypothetical protein
MAITYDEHVMYAHGYAFGREHSGPRTASPDSGQEGSNAFAEAYANQRVNGSYAPSCDMAYDAWQASSGKTILRT